MPEWKLLFMQLGMYDFGGELQEEPNMIILVVQTVLMKVIKTISSHDVLI